MDIIHRLNPFHRPPSSMSGRRNTPTPYGQGHGYGHGHDRPSSSLEGTENEMQTSSIDDTVPSSNVNVTSMDNAQQQYRYSTPLPSSPSKSRHHRTPSILRSLAHHPSISALKNKSKRKSGKKRNPLPSEEDYFRHHDDSGHDLPPFENSDLNSPTIIASGGAGAGRLRKGSKSIPRDMRLSSDSPSNGPLPPVPSADLTPSQSMALHQSQRERSLSPGNYSIRRKPAPSIDFTRNFDTPESVRMRMHIELDLESSSRNNPSMSTSHSPSPGRKRYMSFDERFVGVAQGTLHNDQLSHSTCSPPRPGHMSTPPRMAQLSTTQHPHPVPLHLDAYYDARFHGQQNHGNRSSSGRILDLHRVQYEEVEEYEYDEGPGDGLSMFVTEQEVPIGTPGGKKADLRRGAFVDGARHEKDAIRFFSRDMYGPSSATPSSTQDSLSPPQSGNTPPRRQRQRAESSPSPRRNISREQFAKAAKRSSSPFEIKLSPFVTKRMSLDAFGTPSPAYSSEDERMEEVLEHESEDQRDSSDHHGEEPEPITQESEGLSEEEDGDDPEIFKSSALSTIAESPSASQRNSWAGLSTKSMEIPPRPTRTPAVHSSASNAADRTMFFTPYSPLTSNGLPLPSALSYELTSNLTPRHYSAPPLGITNRLLEAHAEHARALQGQIKASEVMMDVLRSEVEELKSSLVTSKAEQEALLEVREEDERELSELAWKCEDKDLAIKQLQQAILINEQVVEDDQDEIQVLLRRCQELEKERDEALFARREDALTLRLAEEEKVQAQITLTAAMLCNEQLEEQSKALQASLEVSSMAENVRQEMERELDQATQLSAERIATINLLRQQIETITTEHDVKLSIVEEGLRVAQSQLVDRDEVESTLRAEVVELHSALEDERERGATVKHEKITLIQTISTLEVEIESLQEQLNARALEVDESHVALSQKEDEVVDLRNELEEVQQRHVTEANITTSKLEDHEYTIRTLRGQLETLELLSTAEKQRSNQVRVENVEKDKLIQSMKEKLGLMRFENDEKLFQAQEQVDRIREEVEELTRMGAEREWAAVQANGRLARFEEEKRAWEEERDELIDMLERHKDEGGRMNSELTSVSNELSLTRRRADEAEGELERLSRLHRRQGEDNERVCERLRSQITDLECQLTSRTSEWNGAILQAEHLKLSSQDSGSRIQFFVNEIDRLTLSETKLQNQLEELRKVSAMNELVISDLERKVGNLENDKELLNVALESKQLELALFQRRSTTTTTTTGRPTSGSNIFTPASNNSHNSIRMSTSTNRSKHPFAANHVPATPTPSTGSSVSTLATPVHQHPRRLATSTLSTTTGRSRRESIALSSSTSALTPRAPAPLGSSTKYNVAPTSLGLGKSITKRTSLPVLVRRPSSALGQSHSQIPQLKKVEED